MVWAVQLHLWREAMASRPIEVKARFQGPDESSAALIAARAKGFLSARTCGADALGYDLDFAQHPVTASLVSILACTIAGVMVGFGFDLFSPGVALWFPTPWAVPALSGAGGAMLGGAIALAICRTTLSEYRDTRELTVVAARVRPDELDSICGLFELHAALEIRTAASRLRERDGRRQVA